MGPVRRGALEETIQSPRTTPGFRRPVNIAKGNFCVLLRALSGRLIQTLNHPVNSPFPFLEDAGGLVESQVISNMHKGGLRAGI
jgi:hypothetical protein